jgi:hypothetical protein
MVVTNYEGEVVSFEGTEEEALAVGYNVNCVNCIQCVSCKGCEGCISCRDCEKCIDCIDSRECEDSKMLIRCHRCKNCKNCTSCRTCSGCTSCRNSDVCNNIHYVASSTYCDLNPIMLLGLTYTVLIRSCKPTIKIGCQNHSIDDWESFNDTDIEAMDGSAAMIFWDANKDFILATARRLHPRSETDSVASSSPQE